MEDLNIDQRLILKWILNKEGVRVQTGLYLAQAMGSCEQSNQRLVSIKCWEFHD